LDLCLYLLLAKVSVYIVEVLATDYLVVCATPISSGRPTKFVKNNVATAFFAVHLGKLPTALLLS
jgi:hypothetical protein